MNPLVQVQNVTIDVKENCNSCCPFFCSSKEKKKEKKLDQTVNDKAVNTINTPPENHQP